MDYKEKYEQTLDNLKKIKAANKENKELVDFIDDKYPELKESEDESVKAEIIAFIEQSIHRGGGTPIPQEQENRWLAWLGKQGKQKSTYKVEPKFKIGDTIVEKDLDEYDYETIKDIKDGQYIFTDGYSMNIDEQEGWQLVKTPANIEQKLAWSEEDEKMLKSVISSIRISRSSCEEDDDVRDLFDNEIDWLESLEDRYAWKPSDGQMEALLYEVYAWDEDSINGQNLKSLYQDLKKLREE